MSVKMEPSANSSPRGSHTPDREALNPLAVHTHNCEIRVRYAETDQMGYAYHGCFLTWFEVGRVELLRSRGCSYAELEREGFMLAVRRVECVYHAPARYDDLLALTTALIDMSKTRITFETIIRRSRDETLIAEGRVTVFCMNPDGKVLRIPESIRKLAEN